MQVITHECRKHAPGKVGVILVYGANVIACTQHQMNDIIQYAKYVVGIVTAASTLTLMAPFSNGVRPVQVMQLVCWWCGLYRLIWVTQKYGDEAANAVTQCLLPPQHGILQFTNFTCPVLPLVLLVLCRGRGGQCGSLN